MGNDARLEVPGTGDEGKSPFYDEANDEWDLRTASPSKDVTGTSYTLVAGDRGLTLRFTSSSAVAVTVPASVLEAGDMVGWEQYGAGVVTFAAGGGATIHALGNALSSAGQYAAGTIRYHSATEALISGALL